ncbi:uncharacterized protein J4E78_001682 [Alternaria triticimaculans]|uniref:uncharacterized protein n=1 Tax=Alternaria triticimaculans TaxID=297637 RepID=UPI0020C46727|nr:uncharacterized protein J4E78_001682 [Alternaria triticimaculans]KAI4667863.1 hypothetical protein J4E78_001682 [Alternaria triticimaculans]
MSGVFSKLMAYLSPTPEKPTFRITALVAPATSQQYFSDSSFSHADLIASGCECKAVYLKEHYVIEWAAGSIMENEEVEIGGETVRREKRGRPKIWEGWCKDGGMVYLSPTERLRCIEGYDEHVRAERESDRLKKANSF